MKPILEIKNLSKKFRIRHEHQKYLSLRESLTDIFTKKNWGTEDFFALSDVSFDVQPGESLGIIGRNGAGKSTLLKILSKITPPTSGKIISRGRIASLLEVGTGFHPELSGRENVFLNGSILGMKRKEIQNKFDEIVDFSGTEKFLDTPLKHFSSGMQLRLAFAVAAFLEPEILVIDEVLAVGDAEFQRKCLGKMNEVSKSGRTILFVSHNMGTVAKLCTRSLLLKQGKIVCLDATSKVIDLYTSETGSSFLKRKPSGENLKPDFFFSEIFPADSESRKNREQFLFSESASLSLTLEISPTADSKNVLIGIALLDKLKRKVFTVIHPLSDLQPEKLNGNRIAISATLPHSLIAPGYYSYTVAVYIANKILYDYCEDVCEIQIIDNGTNLSEYEGTDYGVVHTNAVWQRIN